MPDRPVIILGPPDEKPTPSLRDRLVARGELTPTGEQRAVETESLGPADMTPPSQAADVCPVCLKVVPFRWHWGDYRFAAHARQEDTVLGEMPGDDCPGADRPVASPLRVKRRGLP